MTANRFYRISLPLLILLAAVVLLAYGGFAKTYKVYEEAPGDQNDPFLLFERIADPSLVFECTISGVARASDGSLYFTYDRSAPPTACPT